MPADSTMPRSRKMVGPVSRMNSSRAMATPMLKFESRLIPFSMPATAEMVATIVTTPMIISLAQSSSGTPNRAASPAWIWVVPRPMDMPMPKMVPTIAKMSMALPMGPWIPSPRIGWNSEETRGGRFLL